MAKSINLNTRLNSKGVQGLKKKLIAGEITAETFKAVIKRQILKQNNITSSRQKPKNLGNSVKITKNNIQLFIDIFSRTILRKKIQISFKKFLGGL